MKEGIIFNNKIKRNIFKTDSALDVFNKSTLLGLKDTKQDKTAEEIDASIIMLLLVNIKKNKGLIELFLILIGYVIHLNK